MKIMKWNTGKKVNQHLSNKTISIKRVDELLQSQPFQKDTPKIQGINNIRLKEKQFYNPRDEIVAEKRLERWLGRYKRYWEKHKNYPSNECYGFDTINIIIISRKKTSILEFISDISPRFLPESEDINEMYSKLIKY